MATAAIGKIRDMSGGLGFEQAPVLKAERPMQASSFLSRVPEVFPRGL
jgi:hypothetical protein